MLNKIENMNIAKFEISTNDLDLVVNFLIKHVPFDYENHSKDMSVITHEKFYFRNNSSQLNMVIAKRIGSIIQLDAIGSAGGTGIFNINLWSEKGYLKRIKMVLKELSEVHNYELREKVD